jgi:PAS domain S-box-containing protein
MGALFLRSHSAVALNEHELSLTRTVANATAIALRNARILQSLRDQTQQITFARFEAERRLKALQHYADFFHSTADGIVVVDGDAQILFSNPRAQAILARSEEELSKQRLADIVAPEAHEKLEEIRTGFARGVFPNMVDLAVRRCTETFCDTRILSVSFSSVLREDSGAIVMSFRDVTDDRATAAELTKTKEFLERVIDSSADAIVSADMRGIVLLFNRAAERIFGYAAKEVVGLMRTEELYPESQAQAVMGLLRSDDHGGAGRLQGYRTEILAKDRTRIPVLLSAALILENGQPVGSVGIVTDLRDRLRMETRLNEAQEELRAREKQALIAELAGATAHELNQPLTSVLGYAELIQRRVDDSSSVQKSAAIILAEAERMAEIVRKIGHITRYETKSYVGSSKILDLERSSGEDPHRELR